MRARELGITIGTGVTGPHNAITDVPGVRVGHCTLVDADIGPSAVRTGVTVVLPGEGSPWRSPVFASHHRLNGNGEMTGLSWLDECGSLTSPIGLTNTHSVGVVRDALVALEADERAEEDLFWSLPVVAETWDGLLNDCNGFHVTARHAQAAVESARSGPVAEGNVGGGTGMICHGFKGGIGTSSRVAAIAGQETYSVGVLVQANHGRRERFTVNGAPVGAAVSDAVVPAPSSSPDVSGAGSIIVIVATDAPLLPHQCRRVAQRAGLGIARTGGTGGHHSGDLFLAFATGNRLPPVDVSAAQPVVQAVRALAEPHLDPLFDATIEATEEAIVNAVLAADTMTGRNGVTAYKLPHDLLVRALDHHGLRTPNRPQVS